jgi:KaiC/GvpD/RAD55 family RecA-like ATPase
VVTIEETAVQRFRVMPDYTIASLHTDTDNYFPIIRSVVGLLAGERGMGGPYVTSTRPARAIMNRLQAEKIILSNMYFVDCISFTVGGGGSASPQILYVESPTMLESIMLKINWALKRVDTENKFVFIDSINTLSIYNDQDVLFEFLHVLINNLRTQDVFTVVLSVGEQTSKEVESMLRLVCDETIDLRRRSILEKEGKTVTKPISSAGGGI